MSDFLELYLSRLEPAQYELVVGRGGVDPLSQAFPKKRVVHPGISGRPLGAEARQDAWNQTMAITTGQARQIQRTAYIHIPFCSHMCLYCGFFQNYSNEERETLYIDALIAELAVDSNKPYLRQGLFQAVFFGGGTPSALSPANAARLLAAVRRYLPLSNDCEITWEARVHDLTEEKIAAWLSGGVNRVSIGVQSFQTEIRQSMGRIDDRSTVVRRLERMAAYNQTAVIIDLIYGLPGQTKASLIEDLAIADVLPIDGMDLYQLNVFDVSSLKKAIDAKKLPPAATTAEQSALFAAANEWLQNRAYNRVSGCHWSKGFRERNMYNMLTKCGAEVVPFGAGAGGNLGDYSVFLQRDLKQYLAEIKAGRKPLLFMAKKSAHQALYNEILSHLERGVFDFCALVREYGKPVYELRHLLKIWEKNGLVENGPVLSRLTEAGRFWQANLAQSLLECTQIILEGKNEMKVERIASQG